MKHSDFSDNVVKFNVLGGSIAGIIML